MRVRSLNFIVQLLFLLITVPFSRASDLASQSKKFASYTITLSQNDDKGVAKAIIKKNDKKIFEESEFGSHYYFGNNFDPSHKESDSYSGQDITGAGIPNLVISKWTGGAHCCHFLSVFELGNKLKKLVTVEAGSSSIRLVDLDHDGFPEIEFWDGAIDYQFASFAGSPSGRVILQFRQGRYQVASNLMKKKVPSDAQIKSMKKKISQAFKKNEGPDLPYEFLDTLMDLSYTGHFNLAMKLAEELWPSGKTGLDTFKKEFSKSLKSSLYWPALQSE